jgi:predicted dienelactone hydrolase
MRKSAVLALVLGAVLQAQALFELPAPTGRHPIATTSWRVTDATRPETFAGPGVSREVEVHAWYPSTTQRAGAVAPYLREGLSEVQTFASLVGGARNVWDRQADVRTHAIVDAAPLGGARVPLLIFSHGYGSLPSAHAALLEDLASHGYAVLSIVHPYESTAATLADGRVVSFVGENGTPRQGYLDVVNEWDKEDETMAAVTSATGDPGDPGENVQRRLLRAYVSAIPQTTAALRRWTDDTRLVLDRLSALPKTSTAGRLAARLDLTRVGVFGHSMGGVTAGQFCVEDRRCRAGLNLDGIPQSGTMIDTPLGRPFLMVYSARPGRTGASDAIYTRAAKPYIRVDVAGTLHLSFIDLIFWSGPLRDRGAFGTIAPERAAAITRAIVREYFDQTLLGRTSPLLEGKSGFAEVTIK